jgi:hypothetical protein
MDKQLKELLTASGIAANTIEKYIGAIKTLSGTKKLTDLKFLEDFDDVKVRLKKNTRGTKPVADSSIRTRLTAVLATLRVTMADTELVNKYSDLHTELGIKLQAIEQSGEKNDKQKAYYMSPDELQAITKRLHESAIKDTAKFEDRQNYLLWSLYTCITPRRNLDYWLMDVITEDVDWKTLPIDRNYLMMKSKLLIYHQHKNTRYANSRGIIEQIDLAKYPDMMAILEWYMDNLPYNKKKLRGKNIALLSYKNGTRWEYPEIITKELTKIAGKPMGSNALRHIMAEHNAPAREHLNNMFVQASEQGHSVITHMTTYIKKTTL